jgi:transcriptional regulator with XRE-family HTH domain
MVIADRLRELRDAKKLSQGDIEKRTGLLRC